MQSGGSFKLTLTKGPTVGEVFELAKDSLSLGRDVTNDIVINDAEVSRNHVRLSRQGAGYVVEDLGSTNGTLLNGQRVTGQRLLSNGDTLGIGETVTLVYAAKVDAGATVFNPRMAAQAESAATRLDPAAASAPESFARASASAPETGAEAPVAEPKRAGSRRWLAIGCGCLAILVCIGALATLWFARTSIVDAVCQIIPCA